MFRDCMAAVTVFTLVMEPGSIRYLRVSTQPLLAARTSITSVQQRSPSQHGCISSVSSVSFHCWRSWEIRLPSPSVHAWFRSTMNSRQGLSLRKELQLILAYVLDDCIECRDWSSLRRNGFWNVARGTSVLYIGNPLSYGERTLLTDGKWVNLQLTGYQRLGEACIHIFWLYQQIVSTLSKQACKHPLAMDCELSTSQELVLCATHLESPPSQIPVSFRLQNSTSSK